MSNTNPASKIRKIMLLLFVVQFFTWLALFSLWIYATPVFTRYIFNTTDAESSNYNKGIFWVSICFAFYSIIAACLNFTIPVLTKKIKIEKLHGLALLAGSAGLISLYFIKQPFLLLLSFTFIGIAWSAISSIPYTIIGESAPEQKIRHYFSVFNFSIVIPQAIAALLLGFLTSHYFNGETIYTLVFGGCSMMLAGVIMLSVNFK